MGQMYPKGGKSLYRDLQVSITGCIPLFSSSNILKSLKMGLRSLNNSDVTKLGYNEGLFFPLHFFFCVCVWIKCSWTSP